MKVNDRFLIAITVNKHAPVFFFVKSSSVLLNLFCLYKPRHAYSQNLKKFSRLTEAYLHLNNNSEYRTLSQLLD